MAVLSLSFIAQEVCIQALLGYSNEATNSVSAYVQRRLDTEEYTAVSEQILKQIVDLYPKKLTNQLLLSLTPPHVKELCLRNCKSVGVQGIIDVCKKCRRLASLDLTSCDQLTIPCLFKLLGRIATTITNLSIEDCNSVTDNTVHTILRNMHNLKSLILSSCSGITDDVFLLDVDNQLGIDTDKKVSDESRRSTRYAHLTSIDVSGCQGITSKAIRHLTTLCGPSLRHVDITWTKIDVLALWYLAGYNLSSAIDLTTNIKNLRGSHEEILKQMEQINMEKSWPSIDGEAKSKSVKNVAEAETVRKKGNNGTCCGDEPETFEKEGDEVVTNSKTVEFNTFRDEANGVGWAESDASFSGVHSAECDAKSSCVDVVEAEGAGFEKDGRSCESSVETDENCDSSSQKNCSQLKNEKSPCRLESIGKCSECDKTSLESVDSSHGKHSTLSNSRAGPQDFVIGGLSAAIEAEHSSDACKTTGLPKINQNNGSDSERTTEFSDSDTRDRPVMKTAWGETVLVGMTADFADDETEIVGAVSTADSLKKSDTTLSKPNVVTRSDTVPLDHFEASTHREQRLPNADREFSDNVPPDLTRPESEGHNSCDMDCNLNGAKPTVLINNYTEGPKGSASVVPSLSTVRPNFPLSIVNGCDCPKETVQQNDLCSEDSVLPVKTLPATNVIDVCESDPTSPCMEYRQENSREGYDTVSSLDCTSVRDPSLDTALSYGEVCESRSQEEVGGKTNNKLNTEFDGKAIGISNKSNIVDVVLTFDETCAQDSPLDPGISSGEVSCARIQEEHSMDSNKKLETGSEEYVSEISNESKEGGDKTTTDAICVQNLSLNPRISKGEVRGCKTEEEESERSNVKSHTASDEKISRVSDDTKDDGKKPLTEIVQFYQPVISVIKIYFMECPWSYELGAACVKAFFSMNKNVAQICITWKGLDDRLFEFIVERVPDVTHVRLTDCESLTFLSLVKMAQHCKKIQCLDLKGVCFISDSAVVPIIANRSLISLSLAECNVTDLTLRMLNIHCNDKLQSLDLSWCENLTIRGINLVARSCILLRKLELRQCAVTDETLELLGQHCPLLEELNLSNVDITDDGVIGLVRRLTALTHLDISWNQAITDDSIYAILTRSIQMEDLCLVGLKRLTSKPFLPIIADFHRWERNQALLRLKQKEREALDPDEHYSSDEEFLELFVPHRSTSYAAKLRKLNLDYCDRLNDTHLGFIVAVCRGSIDITDYYGCPVSPIWITSKSLKLL